MSIAIDVPIIIVFTIIVRTVVQIRTKWNAVFPVHIMINDGDSGVTSDRSITSSA